MKKSQLKATKQLLKHLVYTTKHFKLSMLPSASSDSINEPKADDRDVMIVCVLPLQRRTSCRTLSITVIAPVRRTRG